MMDAQWAGQRFAAALPELQPCLRLSVMDSGWELLLRVPDLKAVMRYWVVAQGATEGFEVGFE